MIDAGSLRTYAPILGALSECQELVPFAQFWRTLLDRAAKHLVQERLEQEAAIGETLRMLLSFLEAGMPLNEAATLRSALLGPSRFVIPHSSLPGALADPSTPVGLFSMMTPHEEDGMDDGFHAYLPYTLTLLEAMLQGPGVVIPMIRALHPEVGSDTLRAAAEAVRHVRDLLGSDRAAALSRLAIHATDDLFLRVPFLAFMSARDFYQLGSRFYGQGELDYYKCGVTSGCVIPEDYYGQEVYEAHGPGLASEKSLAPGSFCDSAIANHDAWHELVLAAVFGADGESAVSVNPYRPIYFDSALKRIEERGGHFHNLVDTEQTGERLRERAELWAHRGQLDAYLRDASAVLAYFLGHPSYSIYFTRSLDTAWRWELPGDDAVGQQFMQAPVAAPYVVSLLSDRVSVYTARGEMRAINRGFWVNPAVLEYLEPSSRYGWEMVPFHLMGLDQQTLRSMVDQKGDRRAYWLSRFVHGPVRALFNDACRVDVPSPGGRESARAMAGQIIAELLRPDMTAITLPEGRAFLTLLDLVEVFGRSYGRLRHWISEYNLGAYSVQAHDHRFTRASLRAFVQHELAGRKGFGIAKIAEIEARIDKVFAATQRKG